MYTLPVISVVIPVYNSEKFLRQCLDSVINQSYKFIDIIVIDDGSNDNSLFILKEYSQKDVRIRFFSQKNQGLSITRNRGIKLAKGDYISFLDSDDWLEIDAYEKLVNCIKSYDIDLLIFNLKFFYQEKQCYSDNVFQFDKYNLKENIYHSWEWKQQIIKIAPYAPLKLYNKKFLIKNNLSFSPGLLFEDAPFHFQCISLAKNIFILDKCLMYYRQHSMSITNRKNDQHFDIFKISHIIDDFLVKNNLDFLKSYALYFKINCYYHHLIYVTDISRKKYFDKVKQEFKEILLKSGQFISGISRSSQDLFFLFIFFSYSEFICIVNAKKSIKKGPLIFIRYLLNNAQVGLINKKIIYEKFTVKTKILIFILKTFTFLLYKIKHIKIIN